MNSKYIFVLGSVVSSVGKGVTVGSIGRLLKDRHYSVAAMKMDPYLNANPSTISPYQHGETFMLSSGVGADLDLGTYERFLNVNLPSSASETSGKIYKRIFKKEEEGFYGGKTIQIVPHVTDEIKNSIRSMATESNADIVLIECGGTPGDLEAMPYLEAARQMRSEEGKENVLFVVLTYLPYINAAHELKTKPVQHGVATIRSYGIQPDIIIARFDNGIFDDEAKNKIKSFCDVDSVFENKTVDSILEVPLSLREQGLDISILKKLGLPVTEVNETWTNIVKGYQQVIHDYKNNIRKRLDIAICGNFIELPDAYKSVSESLVHGGIANNIYIKIHYVDTKEPIDSKQLMHYDGFILPGDYEEGYKLKGEIDVVRYARIHKKPLFGVGGLGMQAIAYEALKNIVGIDIETAKILTPDPSMLGTFTVVINGNSRTMDAYQKGTIRERYRHCYKINPEYQNILANTCHIITTGKTLDSVAIIEHKNHKFLLGSMFHPEFTSRPDQPNPLFNSFVSVCLN